MDTEKIGTQLYKDITLDELVTYCVFLLQENRKEVTFEEIVAKCFELFPEKFSLIGYPQWPDSARVNKSWLRCRTDFKYITGSVKKGFRLTSKGLEIVDRVQKKLQRPLPEKEILIKRKTIARTREEQILNEIEKSDTFQRYRTKGEDLEVSEFEFRDVLFCTLESPPDALRENIETLKEYAEKTNKKDILNFLSFMGKKFANLLYKTESEKGLIGGMNRRRSRK